MGEPRSPDTAADGPAWQRYAFAVLAVALATGAREALAPLLGTTGYSFITYFFAVLFTAAIAGIGPGLLSVGLSGGLASYFFVEHRFTFVFKSNTDITALAVYVVLSLGIVALVGSRRVVLLRLQRSLEDAKRQAEGRQRSEERARQFVESALDANVAIDSSGIVTQWNAAAEKMFGWSRAEVIGMRLSDTIIPPQYRLAHETGLARYRDTGQGAVVNNRLKLSALRRDGTEFPVELTVTEISADDGAIFFNAFLRDVTIENALLEAQERLTTTLRSIGDAVIATDRAANVTFMNHVAEELTGWTLGEARGLPATQIFNIINEYTREPVEAPYDRVLREGVVVGLANHTVLIARDGTERAIEDSGAPIRDAKGEIMGVVLVFHDVTSRRNADDNRRFLTEAGDILASSLDYQETLAKVAHLATPRIADWCAIDMLDDQGDLQRLATAHVDAEKVRYVLEVGERYASDREAEYGTYHIVRTGKPEMLSRIPPEMLEEAAQDEEHLRIIRELGLRSYMGVPIKLREEVIGVIVFVAAESGRTYSEEDLQFAEQLASRAAIAIENARLFTQLRQEAEERSVRAIQQAAVADLGHKALEGADVQTLMNDTVQMVASTMKTDSACVLRLLPEKDQAVLMAGQGWSPEKIGKQIFEADPGSQTYFTCAAGKPVAYDLEAENRFTAASPIREEGMRSGMSCVIEVGGEPWGTVQAHSRSNRSFTDQDLNFLQSVSNVLATALERQRAEETVNNLAAIVATTTDAILSVDREGIITNWNQGAENVFGYTAAEAIGQHMYIIVPPEEREDIQDKLQRLLDGELVKNYESTRVRKDGKTVQVSIAATPIVNATGEVLAISVIARDITESVRSQLALAESEGRFRNLADSAPVLIWLGGADGGCGYVNRGWLNFTGRTIEQELGTGWLDSIHPDDRTHCEAVYSSAFESQRPFDVEYRMRRFDGEYRWLLSRGIPRLNDKGEFEGYIGSGIDITEQRLASEALRNINVDLEQRVRERTAELEAANTELEAFSYSVSHDLRAPLRALDGFSRILLEDYAGSLDEEGRDYLSRIRLASQRMAQLIEDLLNLAYVTRTEMHREDVDLTGMLQGIADELNSRQPEKQVELVVAPGMKVYADPRLLKAAMDNLMQNAWKFSSKTERPRVEAGVEDGAFFIRDNGAGFDQSYANKLFMPFQRLHSTSEFPGTGVGLATVQRIIQRHGGSVRAQGEVGKGATVYFSL